MSNYEEIIKKLQSAKDLYKKQELICKLRNDELKSFSPNNSEYEKLCSDLRHEIDLYNTAAHNLVVCYMFCEDLNLFR